MTDILTGLLVVITAFYAWATFRILRVNEALVGVMREQVAALNRPYVRIAPLIRTGTQLIELSVKNIGRSPANELRLTLSRSFFQNGEKAPGRDLATFAAFTQTIGSLPPEAELRFTLGVGPTLLASDANLDIAPHVFDVTASYRFGDTAFSEQTAIDLRPFALSLVTHDPVADEIAKLRESLERLATRRNGL